MFAKIFTQILDSSLAEDWQTRVVFEDMLKLCDQNGVVDMTPEVFARRTNVPQDIVNRGIAELEKPDPRSRNPDHEGRRIIRLDKHRDWGWLICNYEHYRKIASDEQRREKTANRVRRFRENHPTVTPCNAYVTPGNSESRGETPDNACNAMQKEKQKQKEIISNTQEGGAVAPVRSKFQIPSLDEIKLQCAKIGLPDTEAEKFHNYYASNGWKVGRNPMRDWKASLSNWRKNWQERSGNNPPKETNVQQNITLKRLL